jgi:hypothetical protein
VPERPAAIQPGRPRPISARPTASARTKQGASPSPCARRIARASTSPGARAGAST